MSFIVKIRGDATRPMLCVYTCPEHGEFDAEVTRDENGGAPETIRCQCAASPEYATDETGRCMLEASWTPSPLAVRVRRIEAVKGKWEKPERKTYLDTRDLAEGMDPDDFQAKRAQIWEEKRQEQVMAFKKGL